MGLSFGESREWSFAPEQNVFPLWHISQDDMYRGKKRDRNIFALFTRLAAAASDNPNIWFFIDVITKRACRLVDAVHLT
jgi:hypothetical protein